jgi:hypothetical protein
MEYNLAIYQVFIKVISGKPTTRVVEKFKAVLPLRRCDCDSIKKSLYGRLLVEPSVRHGASPTSATTMR